jgi:hypothetical protein
MFAYIGVHNDKHVRKYDVYEVLAHQDGEHAGVVVADNAEVAGAAAVPPLGADLDERILQIVQEQLALIIGPMACVLVKRAMRKSSSLDQLYRLLAREIPTEQERERFLSGRDRLH